MAETESFEYTYSAPQNSEVRAIREKYLPKEVDKLDQLRALDAKATKRGSALSITHGIISALTLGLGMSCCLVWSGKWMIPGIIIGCIGLVGVGIAYPLYHHIIKKDRERFAPEILRLSEELLASIC